MRFVWGDFGKSVSVRLSSSSQRVLMTHWESVLMWRWSEFGISVRALWIARSLPVLFDWVMFLPTGAAVFLGSLGPNQVPIPAQALVSPLRRQEPLVKMVVLRGEWEGRALLAGDRESFFGLTKMQRCSWMSPKDVVDGLKILTFLAGSIALALVAIWSLSVMFLSKRWMLSNGLNLGERSMRRRQASLKHLWGWGQPLDLYSEQFWHGQDLLFLVCCGFSWWVSWIIRSKTVHTLWVFHRHLLVGLCSWFFAFVSFPGWNQARRLSLWSMQIFGELSVRLFLAPVFWLALRSWGSCLLVRHLHFN